MSEERDFLGDTLSEIEATLNAEKASIELNASVAKERPDDSEDHENEEKRSPSEIGEQGASEIQEKSNTSDTKQDLKEYSKDHEDNMSEVEERNSAEVEENGTSEIEEKNIPGVNKGSAPENSQYDPKNIRYEGDLAVYTDPDSGYQYEWDKAKNEWVPHVTYGFEDDTHTYTDGDGAKFFWDKEKSAWFPKIDDDFMARYQLNYGFAEDLSKPAPVKADPPEEPKPRPQPPEKGVKRKASEPTWFELDNKENTKVYVSNLPLDIKEDEFAEIMQKCGIVMREPATGKLKIKLYTEPGSTSLKGDALCTYIRTESVDLALGVLDGYDVRGKRMKVERATFQMKGDYDPKLKPKGKKRKEKDKIRKMQQKLFDWRPEKQPGERAKHERVVIVRNVFESKMFDEDACLILEFQQDLREECSKCGVVRKVIIYDRHPEGVAQVNMAEPEEADACVALLNGRWFGKRLLSAAIWDGRTKFKIAETDSQINQRIDKWEKFLEADEPEGTPDQEKT